MLENNNESGRIANPRLIILQGKLGGCHIADMVLLVSFSLLFMPGLQ